MARSRRWAYHLTYQTDLPSIARKGLRVQSDVVEAWDNIPAIYFVSSLGAEGGAPYDSEVSAWVRFPWPSDTPPPFRGDTSGEYRTLLPVSPEDIEVLREGSEFPSYESSRTKWKQLVRKER